MSDDGKAELHADGTSDKPHAIKIKDPDSQSRQTPETRQLPPAARSPRLRPSDFIRTIHNVKKQMTDVKKQMTDVRNQGSNTNPDTRYLIPESPGGGDRTRTDDPLLAKQALSQLSYTPGPDDGCQMTTQYRQLDWWAGEDLNLRPHAYQARALTN